MHGIEEYEREGARWAWVARPGGRTPGAERGNRGRPDGEEEAGTDSPNTCAAMIRRLCVLLVIGCVAAALVPVRAQGALTLASTEVLRPVFAKLLGDPSLMRMDVVPDLYAGGYARISIYAENATIKDMHIDQLWIRLIGASVDPALLQQGTLKVLGVRESAVYGRLDLVSVQRFLNRQGAVQDVRLIPDGDAITALGTVVYNGIPTRVRMQGVFQVDGEPEVFFHIQELVVNSIPMPTVLVDRLERQMNPIVDFRTWPVPFPIRSFHQVADGFILSSQADYAQPCEACGGAPLQLKP